MNPYLFMLYSVKTNQQKPHTDICNWLKAKVAPPWTGLIQQPSMNAIMTRLVCTAATRNQVMAFIEAAISYADTNWHPVNNNNCIPAMQSLFPDPLDPDALEALTT